MKGFWARLAPWAVAVALAFLALWLGGRVVTLSSENQSVHTERMLAEVAYKLGQAQLAERTLLAENMINHLGTKLRRAENLTRLQLSTLTPTSNFPHLAQAVVVWDAEQQAGLLASEALPALAAHQNYQLWITDPAYPNPVDAGVFHPAPDGRVVLAFTPDQSVTRATAFSISLETGGAGRSLTGPIVLRGK